MPADITVRNFPDCSPTDRILPLLQQTNKALSHDFCPWANRWVYWLKSPLWSLLLAVALSSLCGIFLKTEALFIAAILLMIAGVGVILPWLAMRGIDVHLKFDVRRSRVGQPVLIRLRIRNRWPWPIWGFSLVRGFARCETQATPTKASRWHEFLAGPPRNTHGRSCHRFEACIHLWIRRSKLVFRLDCIEHVAEQPSMVMWWSGRRP